MKSRISACDATAAALLLAFGGLAPNASAQSASYPAKPIRYIVGYTPAGTADMLARAVGAKITGAWGQQVIVENRPGAGTNIGTEVAAKSPPDGYTLFMPTVANAINPTLLREAQLRSAAGLRAHHQLRESARHRGVPPVAAGKEREGARCARQGQAGLAAPRLDGDRQPAPSRGGDLQEHDRSEDDPRARTRAPRRRSPTSWRDISRSISGPWCRRSRT